MSRSIQDPHGQCNMPSWDSCCCFPEFFTMWVKLRDWKALSVFPTSGTISLPHGPGNLFIFMSKPVKTNTRDTANHLLCEFHARCGSSSVHSDSSLSVSAAPGSEGSRPGNRIIHLSSPRCGTWCAVTLTGSDRCPLRVLDADVQTS